MQTHHPVSGLCRDSFSEDLPLSCDCSSAVPTAWSGYLSAEVSCRLHGPREETHGPEFPVSTAADVERAHVSGKSCIPQDGVHTAGEESGIPVPADRRSAHPGPQSDIFRVELAVDFGPAVPVSCTRDGTVGEETPDRQASDAGRWGPAPGGPPRRGLSAEQPSPEELLDRALREHGLCTEPVGSLVSSLDERLDRVLREMGSDAEAFDALCESLFSEDEEGGCRE